MRAEALERQSQVYQCTGHCMPGISRCGSHASSLSTLETHLYQPVTMGAQIFLDRRHSSMQHGPSP
jgi:hypothetical protein